MPLKLEKLRSHVVELVGGDAVIVTDKEDQLVFETMKATLEALDYGVTSTGEIYNRTEQPRSVVPMKSGPAHSRYGTARRRR